MTEEKVLTITDKETEEFECQIDFQDAPSSYRIARIAQLAKKYPMEKYNHKWS